MSASQTNKVNRCERKNCARATFVETDEGISADFYHGGRSHREVFTVEQMKVYLAARGFVIVEAAQVLKKVA